MYDGLTQCDFDCANVSANTVSDEFILCEIVIHHICEQVFGAGEIIWLIGLKSMK